MSDTLPTEVIEKHIEVAGEGETLAIKRDSLEDTLWLADNIDKIIEAEKKIFMGILKMTSPNDFVAFGKGEKETVELSGAACERISRLGVSFINWSPVICENLSDEKGDWFRYIYECDATFRGRVHRVMGIVSSRTKFFGKKDGELKELWEVDRESVQKAAFRECKKEGVKSLLGLRHLNRAELEKYGVKVVASGGHDFKSKEEKAEAAQTANIQVAEVLFKKTASWTRFTIKDQAGIAYTTFSRTIGEAAATIRDSKSTVPIVFVKDDYGLKVLSLNGISES